MKPGVFVAAHIPEAGTDLLKDSFELDIWTDEAPPDRQTFLDRIADKEGLIAIPGKTTAMDREALDHAPDLKVVSSYSVGYDHIDVGEATKRGILVTNTPDVLTDATADVAFGLLLMTARRMGEGERMVRTGKWKHWGPRTLLGQQAAGSSLGIVGLGRIGAAMARRAQGFSMKLFYTGRHRNAQLEEELGITFLPMEEMLETCDFISLHCPLTPETTGLIGEPELRAMKPGAILVNTSRGPVVDTQALCRALKEGWIAGAGLDVFDREPLPMDSPLLELENVVLEPHIGSASRQAREGMAVMAAGNLLAAMAGKRPPQLVNPEAWKGE